MSIGRLAILQHLLKHEHFELRVHPQGQNLRRVALKNKTKGILYNRLKVRSKGCARLGNSSDVMVYVFD
jgi:hypothetical protein